jgi:Tol biopolymer transport system component
VRRKLEQVELPGEHDAAERAWRVVRSAFAEYEPRPPARRPVGLLAASVTAVAVALVVVAVSPAGPALVRSVREAVGTEHVQQALVALPAGGRLLVDSNPGPWIVNADGSKRLLGPYSASGWSPHGLFEIVARGHELAALDPKGNVRWSIERPGVIRDPRWSPDGYRVAYRAGRSLRVVAGDGTGDRLLAQRVAALPPAWQPGRTHALAYVTENGAVLIVDTDSGATIARRHGTNRPRGLVWSPDGKQLLSFGRDTVEVRTAELARVQSLLLRTATIAAAAWAPTGGRYALVSYDKVHDRSSVVIRGRGSARTIFQGTGRVDGVNWSPDGRWLVLAWRTADQWVLARTSGPPRLRAIASISAQFHSNTFPRLVGWCC